MEALVGDLRQRFEFIVFDSPPLLLVTDGILLSAMADGVVLVVESGVHLARRIESGSSNPGPGRRKYPRRCPQQAGPIELTGTIVRVIGYYNYYYSRGALNSESCSEGFCQR